VPGQGAIGHRVHTGLGEHPQRIGLAGRFDDPGQHQIPEHVITVGGPVKAEPAISGAQPVPQMSHPRRHYFQRATDDFSITDVKVEGLLPLGQPPRRSCIECSQFDCVMS